jgi:cell division protein FtsB
MTLFKKIIFHPAAVIAISVVALIFIVNSQNKLKRVTVAQHKLNLAQQELEYWEGEVKLIEAELARSQDPFSKEKLHRDELLMQKEGEIVIKLPNIDFQESNQLQIKEKENWQKWLELLGINLQNNKAE